MQVYRASALHPVIHIQHHRLRALEQNLVPARLGVVQPLPYRLGIGQQFRRQLQQLGQQAEESQRLRTLLDFKNQLAFQTVAAEVIASSPGENSNAIFIDGLFIPEAHRIGEEGKGFSYIPDSLNTERVLVAMEAIGIGQDALRRAAKYARERIVFDRPIGKNQGIQHPLAERWMYLESAYLMAVRAADLYDRGEPCGAEANAAKFLGARAGHDACLRAVLTHGGFGYAKEYHVERLLREVTLTLIAPVTEQLILSFIAKKVLGLPKSY